MCQNLDLRFFLFYCLFVRVFLLFIHPFSLSCGLMFYCLSLFFVWFFYCSSFSPLFCLCFSTHAVSSLDYPNLLGTKRLGCCCCCCCIYSGMHIRRSQVVYSVVLNPDNVSSLLILDLEVLKVETLKSLILT
jgi:hypothetical protein